MSQSLKAILQLIVLIGAVATPLVWLIPRHPDEIVWTLRFLLPLTAGGITWLLLAKGQRQELFPDHLGQISQRYFEANGLCFFVAASQVNGICWMNIFFQNRYANPCAARIGILPTKFIGRYSLARIDVNIDCDGGAFGVVRVPWGIPRKYHGKKITCQVGGNTTYPAGKGRRLRYREGLSAIGVPTTGAKVASALLTIALGLIGVIRISRCASVKFVLPGEVSETIPSGLSIVREILWRPDLPTGGFPVIMSATQHDMSRV